MTVSAGHSYGGGNSAEAQIQGHRSDTYVIHLYRFVDGGVTGHFLFHGYVCVNF